MLFTTQVLSVSSTVVVVTIGGIAGYRLAPEPSWATLPVALMVVGTALATVPAAMSMQRWGRRNGFLLGALLGASGAGGAALAVDLGNFLLFCGAIAVMGTSLAFSQHFRFAAAESVSAERVSFAVSFILLGSILGAFAAPEIVAWSGRAAPLRPFVFAFLVLIGLYAAIAVITRFLAPSPLLEAQQPGDGRRFAAVVRQPLFVTAVLAGVVGQGVMTYVMTATPIAMNVDAGFSLQDTAAVVRAHVIAMYAPSLVTPFIIARLGLRVVMLIGLVTLGATVAVGLIGDHYMHFLGHYGVAGRGLELFVCQRHHAVDAHLSQRGAFQSPGRERLLRIWCLRACLAHGG